MPKPLQPQNQLTLSDAELSLLAQRIDQDYFGAHSDHQTRMERFRRYYQLWRNRVDPPAPGEEEASNFSVPVLQWQLFAKWAQSLQALFGDDAEVTAVPVGPSDQRIVHKVGRYMTWRVFDSMDVVNPFAIFEFRKLLNGRSHAYAPWVRDTYQTPQGEQVWYEGPGFTPLWPDDFIVPAEDVQTLHDFSFVIRKYRATPQMLLEGERDGRYFGIAKDFERLVNFSMQKLERDWMGDEIKREKDESEGVTYEGSLAVRDSLLVYEWYGKWRMPKSKAAEGSPVNDLQARELDETDVVVRYLPDLRKVIGVQRLMDLYPHMRNRRPFVESSLVKDGSYWSPGFGELLESIQDETSANHNLFTEAGQFSVGPVIFYKPGTGFNAEKFRYEPGTCYPTEDPASVNALKVQADLQYPLAKEQAILGFAERVTGVSDQTLGRSIERPNAPRTATGQMALIEQGNIRASLDTMTLREDMKAFLFHVWMLDSYFSPESVFFRVTEEDSKGLFDTRQGGATMTAKERGGRYDFDIRFATSVWSREAKAQKQIALYQLDIQNPLIASNQRALWLITNQIHRAMGDDNFSHLIPEPPDLGLPKNPREEWTLMLQGEDVEPNPQDNDQIHLIDHQRRMEEEQTGPDPDQDAVNRMVRHILRTKQQMRIKMLMQVLAQNMVNTLHQNTMNPAGGGLNARGPIPMPIHQMQQALGEIGNPAAAGDPTMPGAPMPDLTGGSQ